MNWDVEQGEKHRKGSRQGLVHQREPASNLVAYQFLRFARGQVEVDAEQFDYGEEWGRPAQGRRGGLQDEPSSVETCVQKLPDQARLADPWLSDEPDNLAMPAAGKLPARPENIQFRLASDEAGQPAP